MNRSERRAINQRNRNFSRKFQEIPKEQWPEDGEQNQRFKVLRNNEFFVQLFHEPNDVIRMSVNRVEVDTNGDWKQDISWDDLHSIKAMLGYSDKYAIELYPDLYNLVNVANLRHLWILDEPLPIGWGYQEEE